VDAAGERQYDAANLVADSPEDAGSLAVTI
jgi:hypothetical protein